MKVVLNHVALLVNSVEKSAEALAGHGLAIGPRQIWDGEGTAEIYVGGDNASARILLMQPVREGAYERAMRKRGPGLHHIAIDVPELGVFLSGVSSSGWLLHPKSVETMAKTKTAWLARPGVPTLIEVQQAEVHEKLGLVTQIELPVDGGFTPLLGALGLKNQLVLSLDDHVWITAGGNRLAVPDICGS